MVRLFEGVNGHLVGRRADGVETFNTRAPMPRVLGSLSVTGRVVNFPNPPGTNYDVNTSFQFRMNVPAVVQAITLVDLGAYPSGMPLPDFIASKARVRRTSDGTYISGGGGFGRFVAHQLTGGTNEWSEWFAWSGGSMLVDLFFNNNDPPLGWRSWALDVQAGRWVLEARNSNAAFSSTYATRLSTIATTYELDIDLIWGAFK